MSKPHCVTVTIQSESDGVVNQQVILKEFASTPEELVEKNFAISDCVIGALNAGMRAMAAPFLKGKK